MNTAEKKGFGYYLLHPSEYTIILSEISFIIGLIIGIIGVAVILVAYQTSWWMRGFIILTDFCIIGMQLVALRNTFARRRAYLDMQEQMKQMEQQMDYIK